MHRIAVGIGVLLLLPMLCLPVLAAENQGTLNLHCATRLNGQKYCFAGDEFSLVKIADVKATQEEKTQQLCYTALPEYQTIDCDWGALCAKELRIQAKAAAEIAAQKGEYTASAAVNQQGNVSFANLAPALYLVVRTKTKDQNQDYFVEPFLISIPMKIEEKLVYTVTASPKYGWTKPEGSISVLTKPALSPSPMLPQTGQLKWPVPVLFLTGAVLIFAGIKMYKHK